MRTPLTVLGIRVPGLHLLGGPFVGAALALASVGQAVAGDLVAIDRNGRPVAGVTLELDETPVGTFGTAPATTFVTTDENGRATLPESKKSAIDIRSRSPEWAVSFIHAPRREDREAAPDLLQRLPVVLDLEGTVACVLEPTGTLEVHILGAGPTQRFHVTFIDERPEPEAHRTVRSSHSFTGATARLRVPPGRGSLYVARDGTLGSLALDGQGQLLVAVSPGGTTRIDLRVEAGPEALLLAPFGTIPFAKLHALAPDGRTVVAEWPFEKSPLRLRSSAVTLGGLRGKAAAAPRRKHLLRAVDVPLQRPVAPPSADDGTPQRTLQPAPMELIFAIDVGGKLRLPETEGGWVRAAQTGSMILAGAGGLGFPSGMARPAMGVLDRNPPVAGSWTAEIATVDGAGRPAPYREVMVLGVGHVRVRGLTDGAGRLRISGSEGIPVDVALLADTTRRVTVAPPEGATEDPPEGAPDPATLVVTDEFREVVGTWSKGPGQQPMTGTSLSLVPVDGKTAGRFFATVGTPVAAPGSDGRFRFAAIAPGLYELVAGDGSRASLRVEAGSEPLAITLEGTGETFAVSASK